MRFSEEIGAEVESYLEGDQFLVDVILKGTPGTQKLIVLVDSDESVTIDACAKISRQLSTFLEERSMFDTAYTLEVSSAGLDHPLKLKRQYSKNLGRNVRVYKEDESQLEGKLIKMEEEKIVIEKSLKKGETELIEVPFEEIKKTMVLVSFSKQG